MPKSNANLALKGLDEMFSTEESRQEQKREQVQQIPIEELFPFKEHPFKVLDDEAMQRTVESVAQYGVLAPLIARPRPEGGYEIISGHRRQHAAELAGLDTLPVIVREMTDDAAVAQKNYLCHSLHIPPQVFIIRYTALFSNVDSGYFSRISTLFSITFQQNGVVMVYQTVLYQPDIFRSCRSDDPGKSTSFAICSAAWS